MSKIAKSYNFVVVLNDIQLEKYDGIQTEIKPKVRLTVSVTMMLLFTYNNVFQNRCKSMYKYTHVVVQLIMPHVTHALRPALRPKKVIFSSWDSTENRPKDFLLDATPDAEHV